MPGVGLTRYFSMLGLSCLSLRGAGLGGEDQQVKHLLSLVWPAWHLWKATPHVQGCDWYGISGENVMGGLPNERAEEQSSLNPSSVNVASLCTAILHRDLTGIQSIPLTSHECGSWWQHQR